jgi:DNA repair protein SbcC/Rad50
MRVETVSVEAFGALEDETLELAPGMTVVFGPNESGKTTLHAATYGALCGMRRGRGQPRTEDREFADRHRPWSGAPWRVRAVVRLGDGRRIELHHDLEGRVDSRAVDLGLGRDVSDEIMFEGAPDGSRWLGFDRRSFVATACVRQAEIAHVLDNADALQDELQRAAASAGRDETAGQAIERLRAFSSESVGLDRTNSRKPLRRAIVRVQAAEAALDDANRVHADYLEALAGLDERERERDEAVERLRIAEAVLARADAEEERRQAVRATELAALYPEEPAAASGAEELANAVAKALALWESTPPEPDLSGRSVIDLENELGALPDEPDGDLAPAQPVADAHAALTAAEEESERHDATEPPPGPSAAADELHELANTLAAAPAVDEGVRKRVEELRSSLAAPAQAQRVPLAVAAVLAIAGLGAIALNASVGIAVVACAVLVAAVALWMGRRQPDAAAHEALAAAERMLREQEAAACEAEGRRETAIARLSELGVEPDLQRVRAAATQVVERAEWEKRRAELVVRRDERALTLKNELDARGVAVTDDLHAAVHAYRQSCREREDQNRLALRRPVLERRLAARRAAEADAAARAEALEALLAAARRAGVDGGEPARIAAALAEWQEQRLSELGAHDAARQEWKELQMLLDGRSPEELRAQADAAARAADEAAAGFDPALIEAGEAGIERKRIPELRNELAARSRAADGAGGQLEEMAKRVPSVAEAEEELEAAQVELARVRVLEETLNATVRFLEQAQERVHRSIAPVLRDTLRGWLPRVVVSRDGEVVAERYDDVTVDPETLSVQIRRGEGPWRNAGSLSHGTKEQIYLLLRAALAEHLTAPGERAPLILDQITAQCDRERRLAVLDLLHELSRDRQVILFTHDEGARAWAEETLDLDSGQDLLAVRDPVPVA